MRRASIPDHLARRPFTTAQARASGLSDDVLRGSRFTRLFRGVYVLANREIGLDELLAAALLVLPEDTVISHVTALRLYGLGLGAERPLHFSTRSSTHTRLKGLVMHRRCGQMTKHTVRDLPVTSPERTLIDIATKVAFVQLVQAVEWMINANLTTLDDLGQRAEVWHLDGVRRMRRTLAWVREGVESPMESLVRLMIVVARLPEPACNLTIRDARGQFLARGDLVYAQHKVLIEYDGWHHERDAWQRQHDLVRREALEHAGWRVIVVTSADLKDKEGVVRRVHAALVARGHVGREPQFNAMWKKWFA